MKKSNIYIVIFVFATLACEFLTLSSNAQFTVIRHFSGITDGHTPFGSLISDGTFLYGMTSQGCTNNKGVLFKIMPDGTGYNNLIEFDGTNGSYPAGSLLIASSVAAGGTYLYGMTTYGGAYNYGTIFKIKPDGTGYSKLIDFNDTIGRLPEGSLIFDGTFLYGMVTKGGANGVGTIFKIKPDGTGYSQLHDFDGINGKFPVYTSILLQGTVLYGMASNGGSNVCANGCGVIFKLNNDGTGFTILHSFSDSDGRWPQGSLISDGTFLYGMVQGSLYNNGGIIKIKPDGSEFLNLIDFSGLDGHLPQSSFFYDGIFLYGTTAMGGSSTNCSAGCGVIYKIKPDGSGYVKLHDFDATSGNYPYCTLISDGTFLYGMTYMGGSDNLGTIFKIALATSIADNNSGTGFNMYPNPTKGKLTISNFTNIKSIEVFNLFGKKIYSTIPNIYQTRIDIDLTNVPKGIYCVKLDNGVQIQTEKIIIN